MPQLEDNAKALTIWKNFNGRQPSYPPIAGSDILGLEGFCVQSWILKEPIEILQKCRMYL